MSDQEPADLNAGQPPLLDGGESVPVARPVLWPSEEAWVPEPPVALPPARPRIWTVFVMYVMAFVLASAVGAVYLFGFTSIGSKWAPATSGRETSNSLLDEIAKTPTIMLGMLVTTLVVLFLLAMLGGMVSRVPWRQRLRLTAPAMNPAQLLVGAVGGIAIGAVFTLVGALGFLPRSSTLEPLAEAMGGLRSGHFIWAVLIVGIMPGISEELMFRGYIQTRLSQRWRIGWSICATALMFAVYHMDFSQGLLAFGMGVYLGWLAERAGSIVPAMLAHSANNTAGVLVSSFTPEPESAWVCWAVLIAATLVAWWCVRRLRSVGQKKCPQMAPIDADETDQNKSSTTDIHG